MEPMTTDLPPPMTTDQFTALPPPPAAATTSNQTHPPYPEMITGAISALKDKDGSSRQAISKYIEKEFAAYLPPTHSTLLTHHLKRLKNLGQLVMVKHSYMLPPPIRSTQLQPNYQTALEFGADAFNLDNSGSLKRKPGRPPKLKPVPGLRNQPVPVPVPSYDPQFHYNNNINNNNDGSEPLFASLGLGDDGAPVAPPPPALPAPPASETPEVVVKRGRGRPPKSAAAGGKIQAHVAKPGGQIQPQAADPGEIQVVEAGFARPGRKPDAVRVKRGRGRPKRIGFGAVTVPLSGNYLRPRGRPKRVVRPKVAAVNGGVGEGSRRRGRPSRNMIGKPLGSLSKGGLGTAVIVTDPHQLVAYQELKSKYEHLQSKVKQVASMVKSCIDPDYGNTALGALQELEDLAAEVNARSNP